MADITQAKNHINAENSKIEKSIEVNDNQKIIFMDIEKQVEEALRGPILGETPGDVIQEITEELIEYKIDENKSVLYLKEHFVDSVLDFHHRDSSQPNTTDSETTMTASESQDDVLTPAQKQIKKTQDINTCQEMVDLDDSQNDTITPAQRQVEKIEDTSHTQISEMEISNISNLEGFTDKELSKRGKIRELETSSNDEDSEQKTSQADAKKTKVVKSD